MKTGSLLSRCNDIFSFFRSKWTRQQPVFQKEFHQSAPVKKIGWTIRPDRSFPSVHFVRISFPSLSYCWLSHVNIRLLIAIKFCDFVFFPVVDSDYILNEPPHCLQASRVEPTFAVINRCNCMLLKKPSSDGNKLIWANKTATTVKAPESLAVWMWCPTWLHLTTTHLSIT